MSIEPVIRISAIEHFTYCPRQCALIHCDGVWNDNEHTVRGVRAHRRVDSGEHRTERGRKVLRGVPLWSESLGLSGRADAVEIAGDQVWPVEYKAGVRHGDAADLQLCAQALCLEEMLEVNIPHGFVWYGKPKRRERIAFTSEIRNEVHRIIETIRHQLLTAKLPESVDDERCGQCQLLHHCLPGLSNSPRKITRYLEKTVFGCGT